VILLPIRQLEDKSYRRFVEWLRSCNSVFRILNLRRMPHYMTLQKFVARVPFGATGQGSEAFHIEEE